MRHGASVKLPRDKTGYQTHTLYTVYGEMLLQIMCDYPGVPDPRTLSMGEIRFLYDGLRKGLIKATRPSP